MGDQGVGLLLLAAGALYAATCVLIGLLFMSALLGTCRSLIAAWDALLGGPIRPGVVLHVAGLPFEMLFAVPECLLVVFSAFWSGFVVRTLIGV